MAGSNHNQLYSSWDLYPAKGGRWAIYTHMSEFKIPRWEEKEKKYSSIKQRKQARLNERQPKISYNQDNTD